jgi:hypothetical protein
VRGRSRVRDERRAAPARQRAPGSAKSPLLERKAGVRPGHRSLGCGLSPRPAVPRGLASREQRCSPTHVHIYSIHRNEHAGKPRKIRLDASRARCCHPGVYGKRAWRGLYNWRVVLLRAGERWHFTEEKARLVECRASDPELNGVSGRRLAASLFRLDQAINAFFRRMKAGRSLAFPGCARATSSSPLLVPPSYLWPGAGPQRAQRGPSVPGSSLFRRPSPHGRSRAVCGCLHCNSRPCVHVVEGSVEPAQRASALCGFDIWASNGL